LAQEESFENLDAILDQAAKKANVTAKKIINPVLPDAITGISINCEGNFQCTIQVASSLNKIEVLKVGFWGIQEKPAGPSSRSQYHIFQAISDHSWPAVQYFEQKYPNEVVSKTISWIGSFRGMFSGECEGCKSILNPNQGFFLPPTLRTYESLFAFHVQCCSDVQS